MQNEKEQKNKINRIECQVYRLKRGNNIHRNILDENNRILTINDSDELDECVFMNSKMFSIIFGRTWGSMSLDEKLLPIVKISYKNNCIYRRCRCCSAQGLSNYKVGLTQRSISLLDSDADIIDLNSVHLSVGNNHEFFRMHPNHATRMSYSMSLEGNKLGRDANELSEEANKLSKFSKSIGIWSIIFGVASLIISIVSLCVAL